MFLTINVKNRLYIFHVLFQMNKRFSKYSSTLVNVLLYVNFIYLIQVPPHRPMRPSRSYTHTPTFSLAFLAQQNKNKYVTKTIRRLLYLKTHVLFLSNFPHFPNLSSFLFSYTLHSAFFLIYFDHHFDSSSSSVVLLFFLPANSLFYEKVIYTCYHSSGKQ